MAAIEAEEVLWPPSAGVATSKDQYHEFIERFSPLSDTLSGPSAFRNRLPLENVSPSKEDAVWFSPG